MHVHILYLARQSAETHTEPGTNFAEQPDRTKGVLPAQQAKATCGAARKRGAWPAARANAAARRNGQKWSRGHPDIDIFSIWTMTFETHFNNQGRMKIDRLVH